MKSALLLVLPLCAGLAAAAPQLVPDALSATERAAPVGPDARGANVLRAQVLLERARFSGGEIDAAYGAKLRQAIVGFQQSRELSPSGEIDADTWARLEEDRAPILALYTITAADTAGPFQAIPAGMADKALLPALGYSSVAEMLGERFHASPNLLKRLNPGKELDLPGQRIRVPNVGVAALPKAASLVVDRSDGTVSLLDEGGKRFAQFPASMGSERDPLPLGAWTVESIVRNPVFHYNPKLFWDAQPGESKARIPPGPNSPVGVVWIDLSKEHYGIHGTPEPANIGKTQSHGCIRLSNWDAHAVARTVAAGTPVILQE